jgi:hypothetical protein
MNKRNRIYSHKESRIPPVADIIYKTRSDEGRSSKSSGRQKNV